MTENTSLAGAYSTNADAAQREGTEPGWPDRVAAGSLKESIRAMRAV